MDVFKTLLLDTPASTGVTGALSYKGTWNASTNTPTLNNPPGGDTQGNYYVTSVAGTQFGISFDVNDWIISNGTAWEKVDNTDAVNTVFGRTGAVVGVSTDYSAVGITNTAIGLSNPSTGAFTTLSATTPLPATSGGTGISSLGTGVATFLGTPTSANLAAAVTNETGSGSLVFGTSPTITTPVIAQINDASGNETLKLASIASAVNEVTIENAATGNAVHISATGGDASVGLHLAGKGASGYVNVQDSTDATKRIMFNAAGGTTNTRTMLSSTQTVDRTLSLPDATDTLVGRATTDTLTNKTLTSPTITGGALNGTLGATTPSTIAATTGTFSGSITLANGQAIRGTTTTPATGQILTLSGDNNIYIGAVDVGGNVIVRANAGSTVAQFTSTGLNSTAIGATTPSTGAFTTVSATGDISANSSTATNGNFHATNTNSAANVFAGFDASNGTATSSFRVLGSGWTYQSLAANSTAIYTSNTAGLYLWVDAAGSIRQRISSSDITTVSSAGLAVTGTLSTTGATSLTGAARITGAPSSLGNGTGLELAYTGNNGYVTSYDRTNNIYYPLTISGTTTQITSSGAGVGTFSSTGLAVTGAITATGNITAYFSDDRLKNKLGNIENALDKVCSLDGFYYEANETAQALGYKPVREVGLSAQSVQKVLPEVIAPAPIDSQYLTMHYERVVPLLVEAIKELRAEVASLKKCNC